MDQRTDTKPFTKIGIANLIYCRRALHVSQDGRIVGKLLNVDTLRPLRQAYYPVSLRQTQQTTPVYWLLSEWDSVASCDRLTIRSMEDCADNFGILASFGTHGLLLAVGPG